MRIQTGVLPTAEPDISQLLRGDHPQLSWGCQGHGGHTLDAPLDVKSEAQAQFCYMQHGDHDHLILHVLTRTEDGKLLIRGWKDQC